MSKSVLVTGGSGLIGINLIKKLLNEHPDYGINAFCRDGITDEFSALKQQYKNFDVEYGGITCDSVRFLGSSRHAKFDIIYHLAGYGQPQKFTQDPKTTFWLNTTSIDRLVEYKLKSKGRFIFMSTSEIYGDSLSTKEDDAIILNPSNPRSCYTSGKLCGEEILRHSGVNATVIRICLAYGPGFKVGDTRVLYELIHKALTTGKIELMDEGQAVRNYIYIDDALNMLDNILRKNEKGFQIYNIGGKQPIRIIDIAQIIGELTGASVIPGPANGSLLGSPQHAGVNIDKYEKEFGKIQFVDIYEGIKNCIDWYKKIL